METDVERIIYNYIYLVTYDSKNDNFDVIYARGNGNRLFKTYIYYFIMQWVPDMWWMDEYKQI